MADFYDPDGQPISFPQWAAIDSTQYLLLDTAGTLIISTIYTGTSDTQPPLIYETAVFDGTGYAIGVVRYATRDQAVAGHKLTVEDAKAALS